MEEDKYTKICKIKKPHDLFDLIQGRCQIKDLRQNFIFRGISKSHYKLETSSLRNNETTLNDAISVNDMPIYEVSEEIIKKNSILREDIQEYDGKFYLKVDKDYNFPEGVQFDPSKENEIQIRKECKVLLNFMNRADKSGLKININSDLRQLITNPYYYPSRYWPKENFYELIGLAQHYGMPTRFLGWSYDYNVSIYFAVKDILQYNEDTYKESDGILWAFNYKLFDTPYHRENLNEKFKLRFYRPEYYSNNFLHAQQGVFTVILNDLITKDTRSFDEIIKDDFKKNTNNQLETRPLRRSHSLTDNDIPKKEKIFYKIIIPSEFKSEILKELYINNYSEEFLFPGYAGVSDGVKNRVILDELLKNGGD